MRQLSRSNKYQYIESTLEYATLEDRNLNDRAICKMIQIIDTKIQEREYIKHKFKENAKIVDNEAWVVFGTGVSIWMIKCMGGYNYYRIRNKMINSNRLTN